MLVLKLYFLFFGTIVSIGPLQARKGFGPTEQDWGFVEVRPQCQMFWWLHYTTSKLANSEGRPLVVWLQGGPGGSSAGQGNFMASGPLDLNLQPRPYAWTNRVNMLYVDSPIGAGYSHTTNGQFAKNSSTIASDFVELLKGFFIVHPEFDTVPVYIHGESYGGKSAVYVTQALLKAQNERKITINLKGMSLVYPAVAMVDSMENLGTRLFYNGILDQEERDDFNAVGKQIVEYSKQGDIEQVNKLTNELLDRAIFNYSLSTHSFTDNDIFGTLNQFKELDNLMNSKVSPVLNITNTFGEQKPMVPASITDFTVQCNHIVEEILSTSSLKVFIYNGQLDWMVNAHETYLWIKNLTWSGQTNWRNSERNTIVVDGVHEGYEKINDRLAYFWINRAGHSLPTDNPNAMTYATKKLFGY